MRRIGYRATSLRRIVHSRSRPTLLYRGQVQASRLFGDPDDELTSSLRSRGRVLLVYSVEPYTDPFGPEGRVYLAILPNRRRSVLADKPVTDDPIETTDRLGFQGDPLHEIHPYERMIPCASSTAEHVLHAAAVESPSGPIRVNSDDMDWTLEQMNAHDDGEFDEHLSMLDILTPHSSTEELLERYPRCAEIL